MDIQNPLEVEVNAVALATQRIMERFQCSEEDAMVRIMNSINGIFNELEVPRSPPVPLPDLPAPLPDPPIPLFPAADGDPRPAPKKKATYVDFDLDTPVDNQVPHTPSEYAVGKMEDIEYVELWYFTTEGCKEAGKATPSVADNTFGILTTGAGLALRPIKASKASHNAVIDQSLSWEQIMTARHTMISVANRTGWSRKLVLALAQFYINLEGKKSGGYNPRALILYHAVVRKQWHEALRGRGSSFNISIFNDALFIKLENQVRDRDLEDIQRQTSELQRQASPVRSESRAQANHTFIFVRSFIPLPPSYLPPPPPQRSFSIRATQRDATRAPPPTQRPMVNRSVHGLVGTLVGVFIS